MRTSLRYRDEKEVRMWRMGVPLGGADFPLALSRNLTDNLDWIVEIHNSQRLFSVHHKMLSCMKQEYQRKKSVPNSKHWKKLCARWMFIKNYLRAGYKKQTNFTAKELTQFEVNYKNDQPCKQYQLTVAITCHCISLKYVKYNQ